MWPRTGAQHRQLILVSSLMARWACRPCCTGQLLLQRGSLLRRRCPLPRSSVRTPPSPLLQGQSAARPGQPSDAAQGCVIPKASKCHFSHSRWQILQQGGEAGCPSTSPAIALTLHLPFQGWEPAPGSQALPGSRHPQGHPSGPGTNLCLLPPALRAQVPQPLLQEEATS